MGDGQGRQGRQGRVMFLNGLGLLYAVEAFVMNTQHFAIQA
ncbi:hypothetical protein [Nostoc spongiaeforme]|nr:hypothetical protein [Nostoc spongiaeforme]